MAKFWIVWNETKTEGFICNDQKDVETAMTGKKHRYQGVTSVSMLAAAFYDAYEDEITSIQEIEI